MSEQQLSGVDQSTPEQTQQDLSELARIRREKLDSLRAEGKNPFEITKYERTSCAREIAGRFDEMENQTVRIAGRIMTWRNMGKASFIDLRDASGRMQIYIRINDVGEEAYAAFNTWDIGDIIGVEGFVFRTRKGEISVHAREIRLLSKALLPLPDKWHGLKDTELR